MIWTTQGHKPVTVAGQRQGRSWLLGVVAALLGTLVLALGYQYLWRGKPVVYYAAVFEDKLKELCSNSVLPPLEYRGVQSFFDYLTRPDDEHCYSWVEFGGEKIPVPSQSEKDCADEVRKAKFICFNEEYEMTHDPCLVYSFGKDLDNQFERDMQLFSCETHAFDPDRVTEGEHVSRSEFWKEHQWTISEVPYDFPLDDGRVEKRRPLDYIIDAMQHNGRTIKYLKSDLEGREWILLKQILTSMHKVDVRQIGLRVHIPINITKMSGEARHQYFAKLFQVFQGLQCAGYKYVLGRAIHYYKGVLVIPEMNNRTFYPAYEMNWAKKLSPNKISK